jgi:hypothetical protein
MSELMVEVKEIFESIVLVVFVFAVFWGNPWGKN